MSNAAIIDVCIKSFLDGFDWLEYVPSPGGDVLQVERIASNIDNDIKVVFMVLTD